MADDHGRINQASVLVGRQRTRPKARLTVAAILAAYSRDLLSLGRVTEGGVLAAHRNMPDARLSETSILVAHSKGIRRTVRTRAWSYNLDGHAFYVLDLGVEGTFVFDDTTGQWSQFQTAGYGVWNMVNGHEWGLYVVGGDALYPVVWALKPDGFLDEDWRPVEHKVNGALPSRSRDGVPLDAFFVNASVGQVGEDGALLQLRWSDDNGKTWSDYQEIALEENNFSQNLAWRSLGQISAPGRIFEIRDVGGLIRLDDANALVNGEK